MNAEQAAALFAALGAIPRLPGALCKGQPDTWDAPPPNDPDPNDTAERLSFALAACRRCPALTACQSWVASLTPKHKPTGVIAGQLHTTKQQRKETQPA